MPASPRTCTSTSTLWRPTPWPPTAHFLAGDFSYARTLITAAEENADEFGVEAPPMIELLKLDYRLAARPAMTDG
jgi:hypothetical protein